VFYDEQGPRRYRFYEEWKVARDKAGVAISGHKTESIHRRYVVAGRDLADAAARMERYMETVKPSETGTLLGTPNAEEDRKMPDAKTASTELERANGARGGNRTHTPVKSVASARKQLIHCELHF